MAAQGSSNAQDAQPSSPPDAAFHDAAEAPSSPTSPRFISSNPFRRSSGSFTGVNVLARLKSVPSFRKDLPAGSSADAAASTSAAPPRPSIGRRISSRTSRKSIDPNAPGLDLAELSKPNGKFRSGIKWEPQQTPEPFMEVSDSTATERELSATRQAQAALASGSTAAAQAHAQSRGLGQPIFNNTRTVGSSSSSSFPPTSSSSSSPSKDLSQLPTVSQTMTALGNSGVNPEILGGDAVTTTATSTKEEPSAPKEEVSTKDTIPSDATNESPEHEDGTMSGGGATPSFTPPAKSRQASHSEGQGDSATGDNHMVARAAQLVLEAARQQARAETRRKGRSAPASPKRIGSSLSPVTTTSSQEVSPAQEATTQSNDADEGLNRTPSQRARSKSDAGGVTQVKSRKSFLRSMSSKTRRSRNDASGNSENSANADGSETPTATTNSPIVASDTSSGATTPGGKRRRYVDTRDLDLLARELAAEAIAEQVPQPPFARASRSGSSSPLRTKAGAIPLNDPRRRSFPSILEDAPLQDDSITPIRFTSPISSKASNGLKPMTPLHSSRGSTRSRGAGSTGLKPGMIVDLDPTKGLVPKEMFLGLGGSPYPSLPPPNTRTAGTTLDTTDPFGIPLTQENSPFDATMAYANKTTVYHSPNQVAVSRTLSGASGPSTSQTSLSSKRRPVLTMTMNDPESEMQGLTKPPKGYDSKRLTPFGSRSNSRSNSRASSPNPSFTDLKKEAAKQEAAAQAQATEQASQQSNEDAAEEKSASTTPTAASIAAVDEDKKEVAPITSDAASLRPEEASIRVNSRRNSVVMSEFGTPTTSGLATPKTGTLGRFSTMFRSNKSRTQIDTLSSLNKDVSADASAVTSAEPSTYATPSAEAAPSTMSPQSAALSSDSDADLSPIAFRAIDLPSTRESSLPATANASRNASRRSSMALDSIAKPTAAQTQKKRPIRAFLRRLSSFGSSKGESKDAIKRDNGAKANFPNADTMPVVDMAKLKQLSKSDDSAVVTRGTAGAGLGGSGDSGATRVVSDAKSGARVPVPGSDLDLSNAAPAPLNEEMAKNGFGTRSAYKLGGSNNNEQTAAVGVEKHEEEVKEDAIAATVADSNTGEEAAVKESQDGWDRTRPAQIMRTDSQTPSSEDSFFLGSGPSVTSRPGSGALMKHGSESAISEELYTPDPSTANLPATANKDGSEEMEEATLASTVSSNVTAAAAVAAAAVASKTGMGGLGEVEEPKMTAVPNGDDQQHSVAVV